MSQMFQKFLSRQDYINIRIPTQIIRNHLALLQRGCLVWPKIGWAVFASKYGLDRKNNFNHILAYFPLQGEGVIKWKRISWSLRVLPPHTCQQVFHILVG